MNATKVMKTGDLAKRWKGLIAKGTIENWRVNGTGPRYFKLGRGKTCLVLYKLKDVTKFEKYYFSGEMKTWQKLLSR